MHLEKLNFKLRAVGLTLLCTVGAITSRAAVNYYECVDKGFISATYASKAGVIATSNKGSDISLLRDGELVPMVESPGAGMYINISRDGRYVGFKSINNNADQAPALLDVETGAVTLLENYADQCGQVSFADDGTMAYTVGNTLIIRNGDKRRRIDLGQYINIANISPDGSKVAYTNIEGTMYVLDLVTGATESRDSDGAYRAIWSPDNSKLAVQQVDGQLFTMDLTNRTVHTLGDATSVAWESNSDELLITRSQRVNELEVKGAEVLRIRYDGSARTTIVPLTESTPVSVSVDGATMMVSYANGSLRGVQRLKYSGTSRQGAPTMKYTVARFASDARIGRYVATDFKGFSRIDYSKMSEAEKVEMAEREQAERLKSRSVIHKANNIGLTAIPYINQVWDTPAVGGNYNYGYVCCAPSSSCMLLGWLGYVSPHAVTSRSSYASVKTCYYSWYVSQQYTSPKTGYVFNTSANAGGSWGYSYGVKGGYGYMWGKGSPASMMASFHKNNGVANSYFQSSWTTLVNQCNANRPYIICLANGTGGHVVIVFRANQQAANDGSSTWAKTGSFICHDPYGDYNGSSYPNWDGRYSTYDWPGYSNGKKNIGTFYWGCVSEFTTGGSTPTTNPSITVSPTDAKFKCQLNETPSLTFKVTGKDLSSDISVASSHSWRFPTSVTSLSKTGGTFTITMAHSEIAGTYGQGGTALDGTFYVRLKSGDTEKTINITAEVTAPPLEGVTEKWVYSQQRGNASSQGYDMSKIRNFAYNKGKLYCVYENSKILVLNAQTGKSLGYLSNGDIVKGGAVNLADVKVIDNVVVASNIAIASQNQELRLYAWESDNAEPYLLMSTTDFQGAPRLGDCLEMTGSFASDCWFAFANDDGNGTTRIVEYNRKDGAWLAKNTKVLTSAGKQYTCGATVRAYPKGGGWWIDGKNSQAAWTTWDDTKKGAVVQTNCKTDFDRGSSHHEFLWKGMKYAVNLNFADNSGNNGKMRIIQDAKGDFSSTTLIGQYPADGLGAVANTDGTGDCMINTDGQTYLEAWVLSTKQGLAYFTVGNPPAQSPEPIDPPEVDPTPSADYNVTADKLAEVWISSTTAGLKPWHTDVTTHHRAIAYNDGKLYVLKCKAWAAPSIAVVDAYSGQHIKDLNVSGISGATIQIGDIAIFDGKLIASNVCTKAQNLRIYKWDNDDAAPTVILSRDGNGVNGKVGGGALSASGNWNSGRLMLMTDGSNSIVYFNVSNGTVDSTPHEIALTDENGKAFANPTEGRGSAKVLVNSDGTMWVTGRYWAPTHFSADGKRIETMNAAALGGNEYGTAFNVFGFGPKTYAAATTYTSNSVGGKMALIDVSDGIMKAEKPIAAVPAAGLGETNNEQRLTSICQSTRDDGTTLDLWVSSAWQGVAHYSYKGRNGSSGAEDIAVDAQDTDGEVMYYNLQGVRVDADNLTPGIYIRRQGNSASKVVVH